MPDPDQRPPLWVGHVTLPTPDLPATHARFAALGLAPSPVASNPIHTSFTLRAPSGHLITFNSSHVSSLPV